MSAPPGAMNVLLVSTYDLGRQPFGLASPAAWLAEAGAMVRCLDLAVEDFDEAAVGAADLIGLFLPMHTATRLAARLIPRLKALNPRARLCGFGLYAPLNADHLAALGVDRVLGGEFETELVQYYRDIQAGAATAGFAGVSLARQQFRVPDRSGLPGLERYAWLEAAGVSRQVASTEASRGCKHLCRHCPVVPVYKGQFRVIPVAVVMADIRAQVAAGATHVNFGDPDFFNGVGHALRLVQALHAEFPDISYDATIKIEHLLKHAPALPVLAETGCLFVTTAVEAVDDRMLARLDKGHTRADVVQAVDLAAKAGLALSPTFLPFTPWTTQAGYLDFLRFLAEHGLVESTQPVQLAIRLLLPRGSLLLELDDVRRHVQDFQAESLAYPWRHPDPAVDRLQRRVETIVAESEAAGLSRSDIFAKIWNVARDAAGSCCAVPAVVPPAVAAARLSEAWYCCAEPTDGLLARV